MPAEAASARIWTAAAGEAADVARLLAEFRSWFGKSEPTDEQMLASVERILAGGEAEYLLADLGEGPVAVCQLRFRWSVWTSAEDCWLEDLFVREAARGRGLGRALVEAAVERAGERGCRRIELDVNEENGPALALYRACGFTAESKPPGRTLFLGRSLA